MTKKFLLIGGQTLQLALEIFLVLAVLCAIAIGGFMWRLAQGPISASFAKDYIQEALSDEAAQVHVRFDDIVFSWPEWRGRFQLDVKGLRVQKGGEDESAALTVDDASIGLSRRALFFGQIRPMSIRIKSPSLELVRSKDGHLNVFVSNKPVEKESAGEKSRPANIQIADLFKEMATRQRGTGANLLSRLDSFIIDDASVAVRDHEYGLSWYMTDLDFRIERHEQGAAASLLVDLPGGRDRAAGVAIDMVYRKKSNDFRAAGSFENINPAFISRFMDVPEELRGQDLFFSGDIELSADENLMPTAAAFHGMIPRGQINLPQEYDAPIDIQDIVIDASYDAAQELLNLSDISGVVGGVAFEGSGHADFNAARFSIPVKLDVTQAELSQIAALFPKSEYDGEAFEWVGHRISGASFRDVALEMELTGEKKTDAETNAAFWDVDVPVMTLGFAFEGGTVRYSDTLMPATEAKGTGKLDLAAETLEIFGESAKLGAVTGTDIVVKVTNLMQSRNGYVSVKTRAQGPLATALEYIAAEPIGMGPEEIGIDYKSVKGDVDLMVEVGLPTLKDVPKEDVKVDISGSLTGILVPGVVEGLSLSGGPLSVATEEGGFRLKGAAQLEGRPAEIEWHQNFDSTGKDYSMQVKAKIGADAQLRNHFGVNLDEYITGTMPVDVIYTLKGGTAFVDVTGDLAPMQVHIKPFRFTKASGTPGTARARARLEKDVLKEVTGIEIATQGLNVKGAALGFAPMNGRKADLATGTLPSAVIGETRMDVSFDVRDGNVMHIKASGPVFDARPFLQETEKSDIGIKAQAVQKEKTQPMDITVTADEMIAQHDQRAGKARAHLVIDSDGDVTQFNLDAQVGQSPLSARFQPDETGKRVFRLETQDAGAALYAAGLYENIQGGSLVIYGEPQGGDLRGDLYGSMRMENFRVVRAPALAQLLSLMSLTGVTQLLGNEGLVFSKLESGFEWRFRPDGNILVIKDGKTSGSSVGLTFGGHVNRGTNQVNVSGTIIPMTEINSLLSSIPLLGNILGGDTGLIAATYTMKGSTGDPRVAVNPLSVLAPGFLRNILFEGGFKTNMPGVDEKPAPKKASSQPPATNKAKEGVNR